MVVCSWGQSGIWHCARLLVLAYAVRDVGSSADIQQDVQLQSVAKWDTSRATTACRAISAADIQPELFNGVSISDLSAVRESVRKFVDRNFQLKVMSNPMYTYYEANSAWGNSFDIAQNHSYVRLDEQLLYMHCLTPRYEGLDFLNRCCQPEDKDGSFCLHCDRPEVDTVNGQARARTCTAQQSSGPTYVYAVIPVVDVAAVSQDLFDLIAAAGAQRTALAHLLVASPGLTVTAHYDANEVYLLQLAGEKSVFVASPDALNVLEPHSRMHPNYRQTQHTHITTAALFAEEARRREAETGERSTARVWDVVMRPGDLLRLPPGFYHSVATGEDSLTLSIFMPFAGQATAAELVRWYTQRSDTFLLPRQRQLACLGVVLRRLLDMLGLDVGRFAAAMSVGYRHTVLDPVFNCSTDDIVVCGSTDIHFAEFRVENLAATVTLHAIVSGASSFSAERDPALLTVLLVYVAERLLQAVLGRDSSPCLALLFMQQCLDVKPAAEEYRDEL